MAEMPKMQEQFSADFGTFSRQREKGMRQLSGHFHWSAVLNCDWN